MSQNRYKSFVENGTMNLVPFVKIPVNPSDYYAYYEQGMDRLDILSYKYYGDANYDWLILQANPNISPLEFQIPNNTLIRIPYPLDIALSAYNEGIKEYKRLEGFED